MSFVLFPKDKVVGAFRGFQDGGLEFHADLALPYRSEFQSIPMHGQFLLVQLETPDEAVLGRITAFSSEGKLAYGAGEEFNLRAVREERPIPEDLREQYLKYRVNIRVLGVLRNNAAKLTFVPSQRRLPHVGSPVAFASDVVLQEIAGHNLEGAVLGHLALGEYIYAQGSAANRFLHREDWMQIKGPEVLVKFSVASLVSRRSFILARAGFGKSNLNKLLFSNLYAETPTVSKRGGRQVPVGTIIFDPDGEYFWPDDKGRPGLCDVEHLEEKLVVFTSRKAPSEFYQSFVAGGIKLDIRQLPPSDVISIALSPERQEQQNVRKLKGLNQDRWEKLVELVDESGYEADLNEIADLLQIEKGNNGSGQTASVEALAARSNIVSIVKLLHDKKSQLMDKLLEALTAGKLCIIDTSQLRGGPALILSGLILRRIFDHNQREFTEAESKTIPTIAVIEEAQSVLNERASGAAPYIDWVKEGRKYDLGALLITQQPGSIPDEILSQGDNWFIFHLLSASDLGSVKKANAHFSEDILSVLLNEPIPGHCVFWSSVTGKPYPISLRTLSFEKLYQARDAHYNQPAVRTYATTLKEKFEAVNAEIISGLKKFEGTTANGDIRKSLVWSETEKLELGADTSPTELDQKTGLKLLCVTALKNDSELMKGLNTAEGVPWLSLKKSNLRVLPQKLDDREDKAYKMIAEVLEAAFGTQNKDWFSFRNQFGKTHVTLVKPVVPPS